MFVYIFSTHVITLCTRFDMCSSGKVNSGERYPNRVVRLGLNRAYMKIRTPNSCCTDNTWFFFNIFMDFWDLYFGRLVDTSEEYIKVVIVHPTVHFLFLFICNVSKYCFLFMWKANKVEVGECDVFMNDYHLCTLETARSQRVLYQDP